MRRWCHGVEIGVRAPSRTDEFGVIKKDKLIQPEKLINKINIFS